MERCHLLDSLSSPPVSQVSSITCPSTHVHLAYSDAYSLSVSVSLLSHTHPRSLYFPLVISTQSVESVLQPCTPPPPPFNDSAQLSSHCSVAFHLYILPRNTVWPQSAQALQKLFWGPSLVPLVQARVID